MRFTWLAFLSVLSVGCVAPSPTPSPSPVPEAAVKIGADPIGDLARGSACANYSYSGRGRAPIGSVIGMARAYHRTRCRYLSAETTVAGLIGGRLESSSTDALTWYGLNGVDGLTRIRDMYTLGYGLMMRESSGKYCEGRDMSASNTSSDTAEAGLFQASYNSRGIAADRLNGLWAWYRANEGACDLGVWKEGVDPSSKSCRASIAGSGPGASWQEFTRRCPGFAAEWAMTVTRKLRKHFGPLNRKEAEYPKACAVLLAEVEKLPCP